MPKRRNAPRISDVARESGFSVATVSRALNPLTASAVSPEARRAVEAAAEVLGYRPNEAARSLRTNKSLIVGVVVPDIANPLFPRMVRGIDDVLDDANYSSLLANSGGDPAKADKAIDRLLQRGVDGLIIATANLEDRRPSVLFDSNVPVVLLNRRTYDTRVPSVTAAGSRGTTAALTQLVKDGHSNITVLAAPQHTSTGWERLRDIEGAAAKRLGRTLPVVKATAVSESAGYEAIRDLLESGDSVPTAIVAANDLLALGAIRAIRERNLRVPQDISVVGFNDMPFCDRLDPPLSTIGFDHYKMGAEAARMVMNMIAGDVKPKSVRIPTVWIPRASTAVCRDASSRV